MTPNLKLCYLLEVTPETMRRWAKHENAPKTARLACLLLKHQKEINEIPDFLKLGEQT